MLYSRNKGKSERNFKILERTGRRGCGIAFSLFTKELEHITIGGARPRMHRTVPWRCGRRPAPSRRVQPGGGGRRGRACRCGARARCRRARRGARSGTPRRPAPSLLVALQARMGLGSGLQAQTYVRRQLAVAATASLQGPSCARRPPAHPWRGSGGGGYGVVGLVSEGGGREQPQWSAAA